MSSRFMGSGKEYKDDQSLNLLDPKVSMILHALFVIIVTIKQWHSQNADKSYAHQRETTGSCNDSLQFIPF